jgi:hypothetical protein
MLKLNPEEPTMFGYFDKCPVIRWTIPTVCHTAASRVGKGTMPAFVGTVRKSIRLFPLTRKEIPAILPVSSTEVSEIEVAMSKLPRLSSSSVSIGGGLIALIFSAQLAFGAVSNVAVSPSSFTGFGPQLFAFTWSSNSGSVSETQIVVNSALQGTNSCLIYFYRPTQAVYLLNDSYTAWNGPLNLPSGGSMSNSRCTVYGNGSYVSSAGSNMTLNLNLSYSPSFQGVQNMWMTGTDGTGWAAWESKGTWNVSTTYVSSISVTPSSGSGTQPPTFSFLFRHPNGYTNIDQVQAIFNPTLSNNQSCSMLYYRLSNQLYLLNDAANQYLGPYSLPFAGTVSNSKCTINGSLSSVSVSGTDLSLNLRMSFPASPAQTKNIWAVGYNGQAWGTWAQLGTWTIPSGSGSGGLITTISDLQACLGDASKPVCELFPGTYSVNNTISIQRSNVTLQGGSSDRSQTKLVRSPDFTGRLVQVNGNSPVTNVKIKNLTFCGSSKLSNYVLNPTPDPDPAEGGCPNRIQTVCGTNTQSETSPYCTDLWIETADTGQNPGNPWGFAGGYAVEISNIRMEDAAGNALSLYPNYGIGQKLNDIYVHDSAINRAAIAGVTVGGDNVTYRKNECDVIPNFNNDAAVKMPRNLRFENNQFVENLGAALAFNSGRWIGIRNNLFKDNYWRPQVGNMEGGTVYLFDCTDTAEISHNQFDGPGDHPGTQPYYTQTQALELWGRNANVHHNSAQYDTGLPAGISNYPNEGIQLNSTFHTVVSDNLVQNNNTNYGTTGHKYGGIRVVTSDPWTVSQAGGICHVVRREDGSSIIGNNISSGQAYGIELGDRKKYSHNVLNALTIGFGNTLTGNFSFPLTQVNDYVSIPSYVGPAPAIDTNSVVLDPIVRALNADVDPPENICNIQPVSRKIFKFSAARRTGAGGLSGMEIHITDTGDDDTGAGGQIGYGCHLFYFFPPDNTLYLDSQPQLGASPPSNFPWSGHPGQSGILQGPGYCRINLATSTTQEVDKIATLQVDVEFVGTGLTTNRKHLYSNGLGWVGSGQPLEVANWYYSGYWITPAQ